MITTKNLCKSFKHYDTPTDRLKELILRKPFHYRYTAISDISLTVPPGQALGIVGRNGAGKSTLLKILSGVIVPDSGTVEHNGRVTGLLELGTGFDHTMSGHQNIFTNGILLGMSEEEIEASIKNITDFSELGDFINEPLRTYSSGMLVRLAFSIAIHAKPSTFLIDEALSVGDAHFQQKCIRWIRNYLQMGGSIVFVSHDLNAIKKISNEVLVLDEGKSVITAKPDTALNYYNQLIEAERKKEFFKEPDARNAGNEEIECTATIKGLDSKSDVVSSGEEVCIAIDIHPSQATGPINVSFIVKDRFDRDIYGTESRHQKRLPLNPGQNCQLSFQFAMNVAPGKYSLWVSVASLDDGDGHFMTHWVDDIEFEVSGIRGPEFAGLCNLSPTLERIG